MGREDGPNFEEDVVPLLNFQSGFRTANNPFFTLPGTCKDCQFILERVKSLERKLDLIFGDHVFINGRLVSLSSLSRKEK